MKIRHCAMDPAMAAAWSETFAAEPDVNIYPGRILDQSVGVIHEQGAQRRSAHDLRQQHAGLLR